MEHQVRCPMCGRRLFDIDKKVSGQITIKCSICKSITQVIIKGGVIDTKEVGTSLIPSKGVRKSSK